MAKPHAFLPACALMREYHPTQKLTPGLYREVLLRVNSALPKGTPLTKQRAPPGDAAANIPSVTVTVHRDPFGRGESLRTTERLMHRVML